MKRDENIFCTRDLFLASTFMSMGFEMLRFDMQIEGARGLQVGYFSFNITEELLATEKAYWEGKLMVEPITFISNMKNLKTKLGYVYKLSKKPNPKYKKK